MKRKQKEIISVEWNDLICEYANWTVRTFTWMTVTSSAWAVSFSSFKTLNSSCNIFISEVKIMFCNVGSPMESAGPSPCGSSLMESAGPSSCDSAQMKSRGPSSWMESASPISYNLSSHDLMNQRQIDLWETMQHSTKLNKTSITVQKHNISYFLSWWITSLCCHPRSQRRATRRLVSRR